MNTLFYLAHAGHNHAEQHTASSSNLSDAEIAAFSAFIFLFYGIVFITSVVVYVVVALSLMRIFKKAGVKPWVAWVPFYNKWKLLEIGGQRGFWAVLSIIPIVNIASAVFIYIAQYHVGKKLNKNGEFVLWAIFIPLVWYIWLAVDASKWNDKASAAPSLHKPVSKK
ncbi:MAG: DUF5684 domain-containing protein [Candidatus Microsaccharimonas sp.]